MKEDHDWPELTEQAEFIVRTIADFPHPIDWTIATRNIRIEKGKLKRYLASRYSTRIATKMAALFDFNMPLDYKIFYRQLLEQVVCQGKPGLDILVIAKQFTFNIYDMNCDGYLDQADLFSFLKDVKKESTTFEQAAFDDIRCINAYLG